MTMLAHATRPAAPRLTPDLTTAREEWANLLSPSRVLTGERAAQRYGANTEAIARRLAAALVPQNREEVAGLVRIAARHGVPLYPISTGRNWGYGSAAPVTDNCVLVDLSNMNRIRAFDADLGLVTVEPGVTQQQLADYLDAHGLAYMVPVTGAGPDCSLLGNALERGYGLTPHADHFGALTALQAVLPDGSLYRSALTELGGEAVDRAFKWGLGPYLDGLFAQGNFGIVTEGTLALAAVPERIECFCLRIPDTETMVALVPVVRDLLRSLGSVLGGINLMNTRRVLAMLEPYPRERVPPGAVMPDELVDELAGKHGLPPWLGVGALYGTTGVVAAARAVIRQRLAKHVRQITFLTPGRARLLKNVLALVPGLRRSRWAFQAERLDALLRHLGGRPSDIALPLAYWKSGTRSAQGLHPAADGCGLLWYAPLVPLRSDDVRTFVALVEDRCRTHGMEPLITLTSLSDRCCDSTVPLLFDRRDVAEAARAHACWEDLLRTGQRHGFLPYRLGVNTMRHLVDNRAPFWRLGAALKRAVDPHGIMAPGRYALLEEEGS